MFSLGISHNFNLKGQILSSSAILHGLPKLSSLFRVVQVTSLPWSSGSCMVELGSVLFVLAAFLHSSLTGLREFQCIKRLSTSVKAVLHAA